MIPRAKRPGEIELMIALAGGGENASALRIRGVRVVKGPPEPVVTLAGERRYPRETDRPEYRFHISCLFGAGDMILTDVLLDYMEGGGTQRYDVSVFLDGAPVETLRGCRLVTDMRDVIVVSD